MAWYVSQTANLDAIGRLIEKAAFLTLLCTFSHEGHMFCKQCIFENLLTQKKENKKKLKRWQEAVKVGQTEEEFQKQKAELAKLESFNKQAESLVSSHVSASSSKDDQVTTTKSWWMPNEAPEASTSAGAKPSQDTHCPRTGHKIKVKDLVSVEFKCLSQPPAAKDDEDLGKAKIADYICHVCSKDLKSVAKIVLIRSCGHVVCSKCGDEFAKKNCPVCDRKCDDRGELVTIAVGASSFAEGGATVAKKYTPAPRMM
jgi:nitric oxide synthase-interacting protein